MTNFLVPVASTAVGCRNKQSLQINTKLPYQQCWRTCLGTTRLEEPAGCHSVTTKERPAPHFSTVWGYPGQGGPTCWTTRPMSSRGTDVIYGCIKSIYNQSRRPPSSPSPQEVITTVRHVERASSSTSTQLYR